MKFDSKYFDMIRIYRPPQKDDAARDCPSCQWQGCNEPGRHRAPMGRGRDGEFFTFCAEHVRLYNTTYNYFDGMSDAEMERYLKAALYGHRPTWKVGVNAWSGGAHRNASAAAQGVYERARAAGSRGAAGWRARQARGATQHYRRGLKPLERKALESLGLSESADPQEIKSRFKALVKRHHPDANGGHRGSEGRLREIIQAYNYLRQAGLA